MTHLTQVPSLRGMDAEEAKRSIDAFYNRFGQPHYYFACHAAFPLTLTPDLLYRIWANFQHDSSGRILNLPWVVVSDLLFSGLCSEVGFELYEMDLAIRTLLLDELIANPRFGMSRQRELANFILSFVKRHHFSEDPDVREFAMVQRLTALASLQPDVAVQELTHLIKYAFEADSRAEQLRLTSIVIALSNQLHDFQSLVLYAQNVRQAILGGKISLSEIPLVDL